MNLKYYKENKTGEEKVLRIDLDRHQPHPQKEGEKVYAVMFVQHSTDERMAPIIAPGYMPESAMKPGNPFKFDLTEISLQEFYLYVQKAVEQFWDIVDIEGIEEQLPQTTVSDSDSKSQVN